MSDEIISITMKKLERALEASFKSGQDKIIEVLKSMHIDGCGWDLDKMTDPESVEILICWHKSNNEKIEAALKEYAK